MAKKIITKKNEKTKQKHMMIKDEKNKYRSKIDQVTK